MSNTYDGKTVFAADMHLRPGHVPDQNKRLRLFLEQIQDARQLVLLGDAWNGWYERRGRLVGDYAEVLSIFQAAAARGLAIHHIWGNRDFAVGPDGPPGNRVYRGFHMLWEDRQPSYMARNGVQPHGPTYDFSEAGQQIHCVHGDQYCTQDIMHIMMVRNGVMGVIGRMYSLIFPYWLTNLIVGSAQKTQLLKHYGVIPYASDIQDRPAAREIDRGADWILCGHLHAHAVRHITGKTRSGTLVIMPTWMDHGAHGIFEGDAVRIAHTAEE